jgi:hypothetical protein
MNEMKSTAKRILPPTIIHSVGTTLDWIERLPEVPSAYLHPWRRQSIKRLQKYSNVHTGERCFIIGNGPSLAKTDLTRLKNEFTMGLNRIYLMFPELGFQTSYYLSINDLVVEQCAADIQKLTIPRFIAWRSHKWLQPDPNLIFLYTSYTGPSFSKSATGRLWEGATVTFVALQIAFFLGFQEVILIGVDHNFVSQGKPNTTVISQGDDPNHFSPAYFGKGFRWQLPDLETSEKGYRLAKDAFESSGRKVLDATIGGKLSVFPKVDYDRLFQ